MKGNKKILVVAVLLLLITVTYGTYAIYRESATGTGSIDAAKWSVKVGASDFKNANFNFTFTDLTCPTLTGYANTIAPGTECYKDFAIDADGSEVDVIVEVDTTGSTIPSPLTVTVGTTDGTEGPVTIPYSATDGAMEKTVRLNVKWPGALTDDATKDSNDLAKNDTTLAFSVKLVARQSLDNHAH